MSDRPLSQDAKLFEAVKAIESSVKRIAVVTASDGKLLGTLTDGDIRRCLLNNGTLETSVKYAMNNHPVVAEINTSERYILELLKKNNIRALPLIDAYGKYVRIVHVNELMPSEEDVSSDMGFEVAVIMAGGEGTRLRPLTENIPKPMVDINGLPLLERQINRLKKGGIQKVYISVNYLSNVIEQHFGDGSGFGVNIEYLRESQKLGTAGALSLLPEKFDKPLLVMNGDVLTTSDFRNLFSFHQDHSAIITVAAIHYRVEIPYGVIRAEGPIANGIDEKPSQQFLCNAGIYAVSPELISRLQENDFYNMTDLIEHCFVEHKTVAVFPVHEYWADIGTHEDLTRAREKFREIAKHYI